MFDRVLAVEEGNDIARCDLEAGVSGDARVPFRYLDEDVDIAAVADDAGRPVRGWAVYDDNLRLRRRSLREGVETRQQSLPVVQRRDDYRELHIPR